MASTRPLKLDKWGITWEEYKELTYFCLQYNHKKRQADALLTIPSTTASPATYHVNGREYGTFLPHGNQTGDPVVRIAERRERLLDDVRMIERAAREAGRLEKDGHDISAALLKAVTTRGGVQAVMSKPGLRPPCGKNEFYAARRKFFWILHAMRNGAEI